MNPIGIFAILLAMLLSCIDSARIEGIEEELKEKYKGIAGVGVAYHEHGVGAIFVLNKDKEVVDARIIRTVLRGFTTFRKEKKCIGMTFPEVREYIYQRYHKDRMHGSHDNKEYQMYTVLHDAEKDLEQLFEDN